MATLDNSNIVNGNTIEPSDLLQLYSALTAGGGYDISISGSLTGSATTATNASKLNPNTDNTGTTVRQMLFASTSSATYETVYKKATFTYTPSTDTLNTTSSWAVTSSHALVADSATVNFLSNQYYDITGTVVAQGPGQMIAGGGMLSGGTYTSAAFPNLVGKNLGQDAFITVSYVGPLVGGTGGPIEITLAGGALTFTEIGISTNERIMFTGIIF